MSYRKEHTLAAITRSASLADLDAPQQGPPKKDQGDEPVKTKPTSRRTTTGGSNQRDAAGGKWKWLQSSKSFHEKNSPTNQPPFFASGAANARRFEGRKVDSDVNPAWKNKVAHPMYLEHLETLLPQFCYHLSNPTYQEVANSMSLLLKSNYPKLPPDFVGRSPRSPEKPRYSNRQNEREPKTTVTSEMNRLLSSPFRVRKLRRAKDEDSSKPDNTFGRSLKHNPFFHNNNDKADAAAWNDFVAPLLLLAGAEAIYADLEHVHPHHLAPIKWPGLYERVARELQARLPPAEIVTNPAESSLDQPEESPLSPPNSPPKPFRPNTHPFGSILAGGDYIDQSTPKTANWPGDKPKTKYNRLRALLNWIDVKIKWLPFHESIYATWSLDNLMLIRAFASALPAKDASMDCSGHLLEALRVEIEATLSLMELGFSLERGRFLETICMARKVKQHLTAFSNKPETALSLWIMTTFQDYLAIMAVVFDKTHTFSTPLYGFDQQILMEATQAERTFTSDKKAVVDLDNMVIDFLRRQDKAGGAATAVAVVLDTGGLSDGEQAPSANANHQRPGVESDHTSKQQHRVELGFALTEPLKQRTPSGFVTAPSGNQRQQPQQTAGNAAQDRDDKAINLAEPRMWPAVYLRTSTRLSSQARNASASTASSGIGLISGMRRNTNSRGSGLLEGPSSSNHGSGLLIQNKASSEGSPRSKIRKGSSVNRSLLNANIFEYETEPSDHPSWPHCDWGHLRVFLEAMMNQGAGAANVVSDTISTSQAASPRKGDVHLASASTFEEPFAVTFQPDGGGEPDDSGTIERPMSQSLLSAGQIWEPIPTSSLSTTSENGGTTFHAVLLSDYLWMTVLVKGEEQSRWHRKNRGLPDTEIRAFLNSMASKLRISNRFLGLKTCQIARVKVKDTLAPRVRGRDLGLRDAQWQSGNQDDDDALQDEIVELMKEAFSVSGISPIMNRAESILTQMSGGFRPSTGSRSPRDRRRVLALKNGDSDYQEFAAMAFLGGPEMYRLFLEATAE